jgi:nuclease S1
LKQRQYPHFQPGRYETSSIDNWVNDCHSVGQKVYALTPVPDGGAPIVVDQNYQKAVQPFLDRQLATGGLELAAVLNAALAP